MLNRDYCNAAKRGNTPHRLSKSSDKKSSYKAPNAIHSLGLLMNTQVKPVTHLAWFALAALTVVGVSAPIWKLAAQVMG
jgi:hypothetical protein